MAPHKFQDPVYPPPRPRGRPRKPILTAECGHNMGTTAAHTGMAGGDQRGAVAPYTTALSVAPRLLDLHGTAVYLSLSPWTIRGLEASGILHRVRVPLSNRGDLRRILFDRDDLDRLIESWKDA